ncbi:MAG: DUF1080 domain-containing protein [Gemmatimonadetes bacterium]|nr:DUF1080 domain-containing protein [Gemmatimonadota bacterium]
MSASRWNREIIDEEPGGPPRRTSSCAFRRVRALALLLPLLATAAFTLQDSIPAGFTRIFNGRDLTGWHVSRTSHQGTTPDARVEDGAIVLRQYPYGQGGVLLTDRKYRSFELYVEVKPAAGTNGGIFLRSTESGSAYQVELVGDGGPGTGNLLGERLSVSRTAAATAIGTVWRPGDWNAFRIRMEGEVPRLTLWVNGVQMWEVVQPQNDFIAEATEGFIGLQTHWTNTFTPIPDASCCPTSWKPGAAHRFRNVAIRELP